MGSSDSLVDINLSVVNAQRAAAQAASSAGRASSIVLSLNQIAANALFWQGDWDSNRYYTKYSVVLHNSIPYTSLQDGNKGFSPDTNPTKWQAFSNGGGVSGVGANFPLFSSGGLSPSVFLNPSVSTSVQRVSPNGNNAWDGKEWFTAKKTIAQAYHSLPATGGLIECESNVVWSDGTEGLGLVANQPIWLVDSPDGTLSPLVPDRWLAYKPVTIRFIGSETSGGFNIEPLGKVTLNQIANDRFNATAIWLVGPCKHFRVENAYISSFPGTLIRAGWDYPRDSSGNVILSTVTSASRTSAVSTFTLSLRTFSVFQASRSAGLVTLYINNLPQNALPVSGRCIIQLTSTSTDFPSGTYQCSSVGAATGGFGVLQYTDNGPDKPITSTTGSAIATHGVGPNEFIDLASTNVNWPSTMYGPVSAVTMNNVVVADPYGGDVGVTANIGEAAFQDRLNFNYQFVSFKNCFGQPGGLNAPDVYWKGPTIDLGTSGFGGFSFYDEGSSWVGYNIQAPYSCLDPNRVAAVFMHGGAQGSSVYCAEDITTQQGGVRAFCGVASTILIDHMLSDTTLGVGAPPEVELFGSGTSFVSLSNIQSADNGAGFPDVILHSTYAGSTFVSNCGIVEGPCTNIASANQQQLTGFITKCLEAQGQAGFWGPSQIAGFHPGVIYNFGPTTSPVQNFIANPGGVSIFNATNTYRTPAPDGSLSAVDFVAGATGTPFWAFCDGNTDPHSGAPLVNSVGDRWGLYFWAKRISGSSPLGALMEFNPNTSPIVPSLSADPYYKGDDGWEWYGGSMIVSALPGTGASSGIRVVLQMSNNSTTWRIWGMTVLRVPAGQMTDNEWARVTTYIRPLPPYLKPGIMGTMQMPLGSPPFIAFGGIGVDSSVLTTPSGSSISTKNLPLLAADGTVQAYLPTLPTNSSLAAAGVATATADGLLSASGFSTMFAVGANLTDANQTIAPETDGCSAYILPSNTLTADRVLTVNPGALNGVVVQIMVKPQSHTLTIKDDQGFTLYTASPSSKSIAYQLFQTSFHFSASALLFVRT